MWSRILLKIPSLWLIMKTKQHSKRKINRRRATGGEMAFGEYLTRFGLRPEPGQESRSGVAVLWEICLESALCVFLCLAWFSQSPIYKHLRPCCCAVSFFIYSQPKAMSQIGNCYTAHWCTLHRAAPLLIVWSGLGRWGPAGDPIACNTHTHILAHFYMHACADKHTHTREPRKHRQIGRQNTHTDKMRNKPSNSTNAKKSAETDRYDTATTTNTKWDITHTLVHS